MNRDDSQGANDAMDMIHEHQTTLKAAISMITRNTRLTDEIYSDAIIAIVRSWDTYDPHKPFADWACGVARCVARANCRKESRRRTLSELAMDQLVLQVDDNAESVLELRRNALPGCVERLPFLQRQVITLRYFEEQSYGQISSVVGRTVAALYVLANRVQKILKTCIQRHISEQ